MAARILRLFLFVFAVVTVYGGTASAQAPQAPPIAPPIAKELDAFATWLSAQKGGATCTERCFVLTKLELTGSVASGTLGFTLEGAVLAAHPVAIPLFGPPNKVRLQDVQDGGKPAAVGFEGDRYFAHVAPGAGGRFNLTGKLTLDSDLALVIPGPLNTLEANLSVGRVVEGSRLSGLTSTTIHFDHDLGHGAGNAGKSAEPTVFQLSRAYRVLRETAFEYRLVLRSGTDLGVVRLPLPTGEKVLDVSGSSGWKVEGTGAQTELVLPTSGRSATISITGTLPEPPTKLTPDARSSYEWWLLESDGEHRITTSGSAKQLDAAESPIPRTQPTSRLYLAQRGELLDLGVQTFAAVDGLAAVVSDHVRTAVLTARGDWVIDESLSYENNGIDYLALAPHGRPIFLATDGVAERVVHKDGAFVDGSELMIALRTGHHSARVQSLGSARIGKLGGFLTVPTSKHALTASHATLAVGLPHHVHPLAMIGGDRIVWLIDDAHFVAIALAIVAAWIVASTRHDRLLVAVALSGVWFLARPAFVALLAAMVVFGLFRVTARMLNGKALSTSRVAIVGLALGVLVVSTSSISRMAEQGSPPTDLPQTTTSVQGKGEYRLVQEKNKAGELLENNSANYYNDQGFAALAKAGVLQGVAPVALPLPSASRWVRASRELVTKDRPFEPRLVYVTSVAFVPFLALWAAAVGLLGWLHRVRLGELRDRIKGLLAAPGPAAPTPAE